MLNTIELLRYFRRFGLVFLISPLSGVAVADLTIEAAQKIAITQDSGIPLSLNKAKSARERATSQSALPDPKLIIGALNLPTDTFEFDQEPMSQLKVGVRQMFPQGESLSIKGERLNIVAEALESNADTRFLNVLVSVRRLWLEVFYWERAYKILKEDEALFQQLLEVTHSLYSVGNVQQHDVYRAELELSRLQEKIIKAKGQAEIKRSELFRWIGNVALKGSLPLNLPIMLKPQFMPPELTSTPLDDASYQEAVLRKLEDHPILVGLMRQVDVADSDIKLAEQLYKPSWGVEFGYSYRDGRNTNGSERADLLSAMVNVSLPIFTDTRQDKSVKGAVFDREAMRNAFLDKRSEMMGKVQTISRSVIEIEEQIALFDEKILSKANQQAEASLTAYQADASDFSEVMRAYIGEQRDRLDYERLLISRLQLISELQFYFPSTIPDMSLDDSGALKRSFQP